MITSPNYIEAKVLDHFTGQSSWTAPSDIYCALLDSAGNEVSGGAYARVATGVGATAWSATAVDGNNASYLSNASNITFPASTVDLGDVSYLALYDAASGGNRMNVFKLKHDVSYNTNQGVTLSAGNLIMRHDLFYASSNTGTSFGVGSTDYIAVWGDESALNASTNVKVDSGASNALVVESGTNNASTITASGTTANLKFMATEANYTGAWFGGRSKSDVAGILGDGATELVFGALDDVETVIGSNGKVGISVKDGYVSVGGDTPSVLAAFQVHKSGVNPVADALIYTSDSTGSAKLTVRGHDVNDNALTLESHATSVVGTSFMGANKASNTFINNKDGGLYIGTDTAHHLSFYANNTFGMRLTTAGRLGIGTESASGRLHAFTEGASNLAYFHNTGSAYGSALMIKQEDDNSALHQMALGSYGSTFVGTRFGNNLAGNGQMVMYGGDLLIGPYSTHDLVLGTYATERVRLDANGVWTYFTSAIANTDGFIIKKQGSFNMYLFETQDSNGDCLFGINSIGEPMLYGNFIFRTASGSGMDAGTTKTSPGTVTRWLKIYDYNYGGTLYIPAYANKTS